MGKRASTRRRVLIFLVATVVFLGGLLIIADWDAFLGVIAESNWVLILPALTMTAVSYTCISYTFAEVGQLMDIPIRRNRLAGIGFVSAVLNHLVQSGGVAGYGVRYALMQRERVSLNDVLAASILHFYLTSLAMQAFLPLGFLYLLSNATLSGNASIAFGAATIMMILVFVAESAVVFRSETRRTALGGIGKLTKRIFRKDLSRPFMDFDTALDRGVGGMRRQPRSAALIGALVLVDWFGSVFALGFCFDALGSPLKPSVLFTGFVIGVMAGVLSALPAGIGVQDGSMAGVFALLGVGFEEAVLAALLFRGVFYLVPYVVSLGFYWRLAPRIAPTHETIP
ncbi:MAG: flippase-like domain-containing protein [Acidimicrobiia bacterium]|nr:flippase-like domain-containing protein [Acidimicrobiia bacterium]MDH3396640.1 flippase-like domain-containing protein [Acidimicrobiia bacterium]MDH5615980.1 flippase-like domain-containing protein [Acidimicrobiia bacterium]